MDTTNTNDSTWKTSTRHIVSDNDSVLSDDIGIELQSNADDGEDVDPKNSIFSSAADSSSERSGSGVDKHDEEVKGKGNHVSHISSTSNEFYKKKRASARRSVYVNSRSKYAEAGRKALQYSLREIKEFLGDEFINSLDPDVRELPTVFMIIVGWSIHIVSFLLFAFFFYESISTALNSKFLSLDKSAGNCVEVPRAVTGTFIADSGGLWEGQQDFTYVNSTYVFDFNQLEVDDKDWGLSIANIVAGLAVRGEEAKKSDLAHNLLMWMAFVFYGSKGDHFQQVRMAGLPNTIFMRSYHFGSIGTIEGDCNATSLSTFDPTTAVMTLSYVYDEFINDEVCVNALNPATISYDKKLFGDRLSISFDVQSIAVAAAANEGILDWRVMVRVPGNSVSLPYTHTYSNGSTYSVIYTAYPYYLPRYPGMSPILCFTIDETDYFDGHRCFIFLNSEYTFGVPLFNHFGANSTTPVLCNCTADSTGYVSGLTDACHDFDLLTGVLTYNTDSVATGLSLALTLIIENRDFGLLNRRAHYAMFSAATINRLRNESEAGRGSFTDSEYRSIAYDFCTTNHPGIPTGSCSILSINSYDTYHPVNAFFLELKYGSCRDSITSDSFLGIAVNPPTKLVENYYECTALLLNGLIDSAGVATGTVSLFLPIIVLIFLFWARLTSYFTIPKKHSPNFYDHHDRDRMLDSIALQLLLLRDGKLPRYSHGRDDIESVDSAMEDDGLQSLLIACQNNVQVPSGELLIQIAHQNGVHDMKRYVLGHDSDSE